MPRKTAKMVGCPTEITLEVISAPGQGTTVRAEIPVAGWDSGAGLASRATVAV